MKGKFLEFLKANHLYPIEENWNQFSIIHSKPNNDMERNKIKAYIDSAVGKKNGLYAYTDVHGIVLYIGKAKQLRNRLHSHYRESYETVPGDTKDHRWHRFFLEHQGELNVYWIEIEDEESRRIIEQMVDYIVNPSFNFWR